MLISTVSLSGCSLLLSSLYDDDDDNGELPDGAEITVEGGDNYDITINNPPTAEVAAATKALLSTVTIVAEGGSGSGVIFKLDKNAGTAYVVTNHHVVYSSSGRVSDEIDCYLYGMEGYEGCAMAATYVGGSMSYDLAVIKISGSTVLMESNAQAATFANSDELAVLDTVIAVGNAEGYGISATVGNVSVDSEYITLLAADERTEISLRVMRTDAAVNPGNSGGGLFNVKGEIVGIVNAKSADDSVDNIGFAIPSNVALNIIENIMYYCDGTSKTTVYRCLLGITVTSQNPYTVYNTETGKLYKGEEVAVHEVAATSAVKGKLKVGDIITSITVDGTTTSVTRRHHVIDCMLDARAGSEISITVTRDGKSEVVTITATEGMLESYK